MAKQGVIWKGQDGNFWARDSRGTYSLGSSGIAGYGVAAPGTRVAGYHIKGADAGTGYRFIDDPVNPTKTTKSNNNTSTTNTTGGGGGGATSSISPDPTKAQLAPALASLAELDSILEGKNRDARTAYGNIKKSYADQDAIDKKAYEKNMFSNEDTYSSNNFRSLLNAANASTGLRGVLSSLGGLGGSGKEVVSKLTGLAASDDQDNSRQTFETNATNLSTAADQAAKDREERDREAEQVYKDTVTSNKNSKYTTQQGLYEKIANLYDPKSSGFKKYSGKSAGLAGKIAKTTRKNVGTYSKAKSLFSPSELKGYLAGTQKLNASSTAQDYTPANSPVYAQDKNKDKLSGVA